MARETGEPAPAAAAAADGLAHDGPAAHEELASLRLALETERAQKEEALAQQAATAGILRVIAGSPVDLQRVFDEILSAALRVCGGVSAMLRLCDGNSLRVVSSVGTTLPPGFAVGVGIGRLQPLDGPQRTHIRALKERRTIHVPDTAAATEEDRGVPPDVRSFVAIPLLHGDAAVGVLNVRRGQPHAFTAAEIALLEDFAAQAVIAIENARLFQELNESNATLQEALAQQTATGEVLAAISRAPTDLQQVLDTIAESAARLCGTDRALIIRVEGDTHRPVASVSPSPSDARHTLRSDTGGTVARARATVPGRAIADGAVVHVHDLAAVPEAELPAPRSRAQGVRTVLAVPLLRRGVAIGAIHLPRREVRPFSDREIALVQTFAAQAVIAIENARLFSELRERDDRRRQELERAAAIQQRLLPASVEGWPGVLEIAVRFRPAVETSGDFYDVLALSSATKGALEPLQIAVGDVAGKGMAAALVTALARAALHATASVPTRMASPSGTLREAGGRLHRDVGTSHFVACALAVVEPPGRHHRGPMLRLANAGQAPVLLVRDGASQELEPPGYRLPLGAEDDGAYEDAKVELRPGDVVVFSSDGLAEAPALAGATAGSHLSPPTQAGELFGFERLAASVAHWSGNTADAEGVAAGVWSDLTARAGEEPHYDDMTLLVLRAASGSAGPADG